MKQFRFSLEPLLEYRKRLYEEAETVLANVKKSLLAAEHELASIENEEGYQYKRLREKKSKELNIGDILLHYSYLIHLAKVKDIKKKDILHLKKEVDEKRNILVKLSKDKKIIEKLREKALRAFLKERIKHEQKVLDDSAINKFVRSKLS